MIKLGSAVIENSGRVELEVGGIKSDGDGLLSSGGG